MLYYNGAGKPISVNLIDCHNPHMIILCGQDIEKNEHRILVHMEAVELDVTRIKRQPEEPKKEPLGFRFVPLVFKPSCSPKFKTPLLTETQRLKIVQCLATRVAEMVTYACIPERQPLPQSAQQVRSEILKTYKFVNLEGLHY